jgi:hypothetical protein
MASIAFVRYRNAELYNEESEDVDGSHHCDNHSYHSRHSNDSHTAYIDQTGKENNEIDKEEDHNISIK